MKDYIFLQQTYVLNTYVNRGIVLTRGKGVYLYDESGKKYLDMMSNYGVSTFGHAHPAITKSLQTQVKRLISLHGSFTSDVRSEVSMNLIKKCKDPYSKVYWSNSGTEAIEAALKFAVLTTGKKSFIACMNAYHGKTLGALAMTHAKKYKEPFAPLPWNVTHIPFNDVLALEQAMTKDTAAFIVEPIQGESGIIRPDPEYLSKVRAICDKKGILLILDEIQTGTGRSGNFLASQKYNMSGDIICLGKGLAAGLPVGATVITEKVATAVPRHIQSSTFGGNPLVMAGVKATLDLLTEARLTHIKKMGELLKKKLTILEKKYPISYRGEGLMLGVAVGEKRNQVLKLLQENGILAIPAGEDVVRFLPPYIVSAANINKTVKTLDNVLSKL